MPFYPSVGRAYIRVTGFESRQNGGEIEKQHTVSGVAGAAHVAQCVGHGLLQHTRGRRSRDLELLRPAKEKKKSM